MQSTTDTQAEATDLEEKIAQACGVMNAATGRLVKLLSAVLRSGSWQVSGIHSPSHWVAWKCGVSPRRARELVAMARRHGELPETAAAFEAGELCEDQVAVIARRAPAHIDAEAATLARSATVVQLRRVLGGYSFDSDGKPDPDEPAESETPDEPRRMSFGFTEAGRWQLAAELPPDEGALVERALAEARDELFRAGQHDSGNGPAPADVSWADALVAMADRSVHGGAMSRPHRDRHLVLLHIGTDDAGETNGHLHLGTGLGEGLRRFVGCDARVRLVFEEGGRPVSVGRTFRTVPDRTRITVEERDRGCRVPGCDRSRWLHIHHVRHWEDGGPSDTANLVALCPRHHRLHHLGKLGIEGDADVPDGMIFTDERGRRIAPCGRPAPPEGPLETAAQGLGIAIGTWSHPTGERFDPHWVQFSEPAC